MNMLVRYIMLLLSLASISTVAVSTKDQWSWTYKKCFKPSEVGLDKKDCMFAQINVPHFNQLIFSWNSLRPIKGYFTFSGQTRDAKTKKWGPWYKMSEWGADVARSFIQKGTNGSGFFHVRLETGTALADAFRIKVETKDGALSSSLKSINVCTANFEKFKSEPVTQELFQLPSIKVAGVPRISQYELAHPHSDRICSPTSCAMLTSYLLGTLIDAHTFAQGAFDHGLGKYGSWPFNIAHAFDVCQGNILFAVTRLDSFKNLHQLLAKKLPVVVSVRGPLEGAPGAYAQGHLLLVIGWDAQTQRVICHDPAHALHEQTESYYKIESFLTAWERSRRLAYIAQPIKQTMTCAKK